MANCRTGLFRVVRRLEYFRPIWREMRWSRLTTFRSVVDWPSVAVVRPSLTDPVPVRHSLGLSCLSCIYRRAAGVAWMPSHIRRYTDCVAVQSNHIQHWYTHTHTHSAHTPIWNLVTVSRRWGQLNPYSLNTATTRAYVDIHTERTHWHSTQDTQTHARCTPTEWILFFLRLRLRLLPLFINLLRCFIFIFCHRLRDRKEGRLGNGLLAFLLSPSFSHMYLYINTFLLVLFFLILMFVCFPFLLFSCSLVERLSVMAYDWIGRMSSFCHHRQYLSGFCAASRRLCFFFSPFDRPDVHEECTATRPKRHTWAKTKPGNNKTKRCSSHYCWCCFPCPMCANPINPRWGRIFWLGAAIRHVGGARFFSHKSFFLSFYLSFSLSFVFVLLVMVCGSGLDDRYVVV